MIVVKNLILLIAVMLLFGMVLDAQEAYKIKESKMEIVGTSSLHDWVSSVLNLTAEGDFTVNNEQIENIAGLVVNIQVKDIQSTKGSMMDNKTYSALKEESNPIIRFTLTEVIGSETTYFGQQISTKGNMEIAGKNRPVQLDVKAKVLPNGELSFEGSTEINMLDYDMEPPKAMLGAIKTGELVTVNFTLTMERK